MTSDSAQQTNANGNGIASASAPSAGSSPLVFERTTDKDVLRYCQSQNYRAWGDGLSVPQYLERERINYEHALCNMWRAPEDTNGTYYWILRDTRLPKEKHADIVCACEFLVRESYLHVAGSEELEIVKSAVVGSVFTIEAHRSKGYANRMIKDLVVAMGELLPGKHDFSTLYSEVGDYYAKFGYKSHHTPVAVIPIREVSLPDSNYEILHGSAKLQPFLQVYDNRIQQLMLKKANKTSLSVKPTLENMEWFLNRSQFMGGIVNPVANNDKVGLRLAGTDSFVAWYKDFTSGDVYVLMLSADTAEQAQELLMGAVKECAGFKKLKIWHSELLGFDFTGQPEANKSVLEFVTSTLNGKVGLENGSLSAVLLLHDDLDVEWVANGKWQWY